MTECDINKDIKVSDLFHYAGTKIQIKHIDHLFSIYVKSMGKDTVLRVEERKQPNNKSPIEVIKDIFNPHEKIERRLNDIETKLDTVITKSLFLNDK